MSQSYRYDVHLTSQGTLVFPIGNPQARNALETHCRCSFVDGEWIVPTLNGPVRVPGDTTVTLINYNYIKVPVEYTRTRYQVVPKTISDPEEGKMYFERCDEDEALFWSVEVQHHNGDVTRVVTDCACREDAELVVVMLQRLGV